MIAIFYFSPKKHNVNYAFNVIIFNKLLDYYKFIYFEFNFVILCKKYLKYFFNSLIKKNTKKNFFNKF